MKKLNTIWGLSTSLVVVAFLVAIVSSCTKTETVVNKAAPTLTLSSTSASNVAGAAVTTTVSISAPEGGKTLTILVNGVADASLPNVDLASATSKDVNISYTIPAAATVGTTYAITFQASDAKNQNSTVVVFTATVSAVPAKQIVEVTADITTNTTWTADKIYRLNGFIRVGSDVKPAPGGAGVAPVIDASKKATLTIEAGTVILGKKGTPGGALIVQRGSKLVAIGTAAKPIIFTSDQAPGNRVPGDWAGIVLCRQHHSSCCQQTKAVLPSWRSEAHWRERRHRWSKHLLLRQSLFPSDCLRACSHLTWKSRQTEAPGRDSWSFQLYFLSWHFFRPQ